MLNTHKSTTTAIALAVLLMLFGTGYAGWLGPPAETGTETSCVSTTSGEPRPETRRVVVSGTIDDYGLLVDRTGGIFKLADSGQGMEVRSLIGKAVKISGTVVQAEGESVIAVSEFAILEREGGK